MKLTQIHVRRLPGIDQEFTVEGLGDGLNVVVGPNGSGKSSLCRAVRATLWPRHPELVPADVETAWSEGTHTLVARLAPGSTQWQEEGRSSAPPVLPPVDLAPCYTIGLAELLEVTGAPERRLGELLRLAMAGGYDLQRLAAERTAGTGKRERDALREASARVRHLEGLQRELAGEEEGLERRNEELRNAKRAALEVQAIDDAVELLKFEQELAAKEAELALLHELEPITGNELEELVNLEVRLDAAKKQLANATARQQEAESALAGAKFGERAPPTEVDIAAWYIRVRDLSERERHRAEARVRHETASRQLEGMARELGPALEATRSEAFEGPELERLDDWVTDALRQRAEDLVHRERIAALDLELSALVAADAKATENDPNGMGSRSELLAVLFLIIVSGVLAYSLSPWFIGLAGIGVGVLLVWFIARNQRLRADVQWSQRLEQERRVAAAALEELKPRQANLEARRNECRAVLGVDPRVGDLHLGDLVPRLAAWRGAREAQHRVAAEVAALTQECANELRALAQFLGPYDPAVPMDAAAAETGLAALEKRMNAYADATRKLPMARQDARVLAEGIEKLAAETANVFTRAGIDVSDPINARPRLGELVRRKPEWRQCAVEKEALRGKVAAARARTKAVPEFAGLDVSVLALLREKKAQLAARAFDLAADLRTLEDRLNAARLGTSLEEARAEEAAARLGLEAARERLLDDAVRQLALGDLRRTHDEQMRPPVLAKAMQLFTRFTQGVWLLVAGGAGDRTPFKAQTAKEATALTLDQLSDGTRVQLLLAARIAFATQREESTPLPLFLDEALSNSDPERFQAVAAALFELVKEGRQLFYLTANPNDVEQWRALARERREPAPTVIDLAQVRRLAVAATPRQLELPAPRVLPAPDGSSAEAYGRRLEVPRVDLHAGVAALHLFHLLRDELPLLHQILAGVGTATVGQWQALVQHGALPSGFGAAQREMLEARIAAARAWFDGASIGRPRPVDRTALVESGVVSEEFVEKLMDFLRENDGDSVRLLEALANPRADRRTLRFHTRKREELAIWLEAHGYHTTQPPLEADALRDRVLAATQEWRERGRLTDAEVVELTLTLTRAATVAAAARA